MACGAGLAAAMGAHANAVAKYSGRPQMGRARRGFLRALILASSRRISLTADREEQDRRVLSLNFAKCNAQPRSNETSYPRQQRRRLSHG